MRLTYDPTVDTLAVELVHGVKSMQTKSMGPDINMDFDARGRLISLEVLNASGHYPADELATMETPVALLTLAEAAEESGLSAATLRKQIHNEKLRATKRGRDWMVARHTLWNYLETRDPRGRRAATEKKRA
jgi:excisionase family DNA binding protein